MAPGGLEVVGTQRPLLRCEAERDSHVAVWLWLDASASMAEPSRRVAGLTKLAMARLLLACVAAVAHRQGDAVGLVVAGVQVQVLPALRGVDHVQRVWGHLQGVKPMGAAPSEAALQAALQQARQRSVVMAVSDGLDWPSPWSQALLRLRRMRHDVRLALLHTEAEQQAV